MRLLFLTNFFPPASRGGYEEWCHEVALGLRGRGHDVVVLTSRHGLNSLAAPDESWIHRTLHLEMEIQSLRNGVDFFVARQSRERSNLEYLRRMIAELEPDAIVIWGMWNLPRMVAAHAESLLPGRVVYYIGDYWSTLPSQHEFYWQATGRNRLVRPIKQVVATIARQMLAHERRAELTFPHALFPSQFMHDELRRRGITFGETRVVSGAIDTRPFVECSRRRLRWEGDGLTLLYAGRLEPEKGVHTAVRALGVLARQAGMLGLRLRIVGSGDPRYEVHLRERVRQEGVEHAVTFLGPQPKDAMPALYSAADVFLFTSIWDEPFGRVVVEAMAAGLPVVGTATGGAADILNDGVNALVFPPDDANCLAEQIRRIVHDPSLGWTLAENGRRLAIEQFDNARMVAEIESYLQSVRVG